MSDHLLNIKEFVFVFIVTIQCLVVVTALISYRRDKKSWKYFVLAMLLIFVRRFIALSRWMAGFDTILIENIVTGIASILFLIYIWHSSDK